MFRYFWIMFPMFGGRMETKKTGFRWGGILLKMNVLKLFCYFQCLDAVDNHSLLAAVDDFGHLFGR